MARVLKRGLDLLVAAVGLVLFSPVFLYCALVIKRDSRGPVLYRQTRVGLHGRLFNIVKFRTMVVDADRKWVPPTSAADLEHFYFQDDGDPRITRVGQWLRASSLDELPNLWNVLVGDMSLVGPRPEVPEIVALYDDAMRERLRVKPGLTGLAQVSGRGLLSTAESIQYDLEYCRRWSLAEDLRILWSTIRTVTDRKGAL
jgi:lipopolysaccharide/colanic/teichoic acid biosynthesis glycosyltransferase